MKYLIFTITCFLSTISFFSQTSPPERKSLTITEIPIKKENTVKELKTLSSSIVKEEKEEALPKTQVLTEPKKLVKTTTPEKK